jgi:hypothetical protein
MQHLGGDLQKRRFKKYDLTIREKLTYTNSLKSGNTFKSRNPGHA